MVKPKDVFAQALADRDAVLKGIARDRPPPEEIDEELRKEFALLHEAESQTARRRLELRKTPV